MFLSADDAKALTDKILSRSKADACVVKIDGGEDNSLRFARGTATTNLTTSDLRLRISSHIGGRIGSVSTTQIDDDSLTAAVRRSEELAAMLPVDPDYTPPLGPQQYEGQQRFHDQPGAMRLDALAAKAAQAIEESAQGGRITLVHGHPQLVIFDVRQQFVVAELGGGAVEPGFVAGAVGVACGEISSVAALLGKKRQRQAEANEECLKLHARFRL